VKRRVRSSYHSRVRALRFLAVQRARDSSRRVVDGDGPDGDWSSCWSDHRHSLFLPRLGLWALASEGFTAFAVPTVSLAVVLALGALVGVVAAVRPAHRAARMDVLSAIATE
jgi:hypothetical protein